MFLPEPLFHGMEIAMQRIISFQLLNVPLFVQSQHLPVKAIIRWKLHCIVYILHCIRHIVHLMCVKSVGHWMRYVIVVHLLGRDRKLLIRSKDFGRLLSILIECSRHHHLGPCTLLLQMQFEHPECRPISIVRKEYQT